MSKLYNFLFLANILFCFKNKILKNFVRTICLKIFGIKNELNYKNKNNNDDDN